MSGLAKHQPAPEVAQMSQFHGCPSMPTQHIETRNIVFSKRELQGGSCYYENIDSRRTNL